MQLRAEYLYSVEHLLVYLLPLLAAACHQLYDVIQYTVIVSTQLQKEYKRDGKYQILFLRNLHFLVVSTTHNLAYLV